MLANSVTFTLLLTVSSMGQYQAIQDSEVTDQNAAFQSNWNEELSWRFDELPEKGGVPAFRVPYSGSIYLDRVGGTTNAMRKYDRAFNSGTSKASAWEEHDIEVHRRPETTTQRFGLFGLRTRSVTTMSTPHWHGHCNGWTAAAIRHAEPQNNVTRNGVVFQPSDIKGLLAELYAYADSDFLGGVDSVINPGTLHVVIANWLGRKRYPIGMETSPGDEVWNYPVYSFATSHVKRGTDRVEVKMNARYAMSSNRESNQSTHRYKDHYFHYELRLDDEGRIVGGQYFRDSSRIDMLWAPREPARGGEPGNERGNPHLDVQEITSMWRESVPTELVDKWINPHWQAEQSSADELAVDATEAP